MCAKATDWFDKSSIYQVNPRTFSPEGTIKAVEAELPFIASLGFSVVYLCPIFEEDPSDDINYWSTRQKASGTGNPKNPYRMNNYFRMDEEYGTDQDLRDLVKAAHELGLRVMLDLVYLHIGPFADIIKRHPEFAKKNEDGSIRLTQWNFPYLDHSYPGLCEYLWCNMVYYVAEFDVDGFRCDVGDAVPLDFWKEGRRRIQTIKPDCVMLNEGVKPQALEAFEANYGFFWLDAMLKLLRKQIDCKRFVELYKTETGKLSKVNGVMLCFDNHDTVTDLILRSETAFGHEAMDLVQFLNYTVAGVPMVYCGNEIADETDVSMFYNRFHKGKYEATDRVALKKTAPAIKRAELMKTLNTMKKELSALYEGTMEWVENSAPESVASYVRGGTAEKLTIVANTSSDELSCTVDTELDGTVILQSDNALIKDDGTVVLPGYGFICIKK